MSNEISVAHRGCQNGYAERLKEELSKIPSENSALDFYRTGVSDESGQHSALGRSDTYKLQRPKVSQIC